MPTIYQFGGYAVAVISLLIGTYFLYTAVRFYRSLYIADARKMMYVSFVYLPIVQLSLLFDFIP